MSETNGFAHLDDPAFLRERSRLHRWLEQLPENASDRAELELLYETMTQEFLRRARLAWASAPATAKSGSPGSRGPGSGHHRLDSPSAREVAGSAG